VDMQWLGERTGKGFYEYEHEDNDAIYHSQEI
jgi:3-hydroxyacyl-CoA dehydrogenase